jgi:putative ABC transport system permease protein
MLGILDRDNWLEIAATLRKNPLRTTLTGLGVFLGIVILLVMVGFGGSMKAGVQRNMAGFATNSIFVWGQRTSKPYAGLPMNRPIVYDNGDTVALADVPGIRYLSPRNQRGNFRGASNVKRGNKTGSFQVTGDYPAFQYVQPPVMKAGRFINQGDLAERRKVATIGTGVVDQLFEPGEQPIGSYIEANGVYFQIIGVFGTRATGGQADQILNSIIIPFSTFQQAFNAGDKVGWYTIVVDPAYSITGVEADVRRLLAERHKVAPDDTEAIGSFNLGEKFEQMNFVFTAISVVMWFAGLMTLLAGVIGVSNIMLISVRERTKEIGVRKALGATPARIVKMILAETVVLTVIAGYAGIVVGVVVLEGFGWFLTNHANDLPFGPPPIDLWLATTSAAVIAVFGALAGIIPAYQASKVAPVEALRTE